VRGTIGQIIRKQNNEGIQGLKFDENLFEVYSIQIFLLIPMMIFILFGTEVLIVKTSEYKLLFMMVGHHMDKIIFLNNEIIFVLKQAYIFF